MLPVQAQKEVRNIFCYWKPEEGGYLLHGGRKLREIVSCSYVESKICDTSGYIAKEIIK